MLLGAAQQAAAAKHCFKVVIQGVHDMMSSLEFSKWAAYCCCLQVTHDDPPQHHRHCQLGLLFPDLPRIAQVFLLRLLCGSHLSLHNRHGCCLQAARG